MGEDESTVESNTHVSPALCSLVRELDSIFSETGVLLESLLKPRSEDSTDLLLLLDAAHQHVASIAELLPQGMTLSSCVLARSAFEASVYARWAASTPLSFERLRLDDLLEEERKYKRSLHEPGLESISKQALQAILPQIAAIRQAHEGIQTAPNVRDALGEVEKLDAPAKAKGATGDSGLKYYQMFFSVLSGHTHGGLRALRQAHSELMPAYLVGVVGWIVRCATFTACAYLRRIGREADVEKFTDLYHRAEAIQQKHNSLLKATAEQSSDTTVRTEPT